MAQLGTINLSVTRRDNNGKPSLRACLSLNQQVAATNLGTVPGDCQY
jgi:hypothetical protein